VAYALQFHENNVAPYLLALDLSREGRLVLNAALHRELCVLGDAHINNLARRLAPGSEYFRIDLVFRDPVRRIIHQLELIISDAAAPYGVLGVVYAEDRTKA
jgi:hypothetical protein